MPSSRPESQQPPPTGRKRSNTVQSHFKHAPPVLPAPLAPPLKRGDSRVLTTWVHDGKDSPNVVLNYSYWPGVVEGDMLRLRPYSSQSSAEGAHEPPGVLCVVGKDEAQKHQLQVSFLCLTLSRFQSDLYTRYPFLGLLRRSLGSRIMERSH